MQISVVDICNMALANIGQNAIQSIEGPSISQRSCKMRYDEARMEALRGALWNFASLWKTGTRLDIAPKPPWRYVFQYPPDALRVFEIQRARGQNKEIPFEVTDRPDQSGKIIHSDMAAPTFIYTRDRQDPTTFDWDFVVAMSWLLSSKIAMSITKSLKLQQEAFKMWMVYASQAKAATANEGLPESDNMASYQEAR